MKWYRLTAVTCLFLWTAATADQKRAHAGEPVIRTFAFVVGSDRDADIPDFLGNDSLLVRARKPKKGESTGDSTSFLDSENWPGHPGQPEFIEGSVWARYPATHIVRGGQSHEGLFMWLLTEDTPTPPPAGAITFTGDRGRNLILSVEVFEVNLCANSGCNFDSSLDGRAYIVNDFTGGIGDYWIVVTAVFSK